MGLKQDSKVLILLQANEDQHVKVIIKESVVEFRRNNNDAILMVMSKSEVEALYQETFPPPKQDV